MNRVNFLRDVLPATGYYCLFSKSKNKKFPTQSFFLTIDELVEEADTRSDEDVYFALANYADDSERLKTNAKSLRAMFLDLDSKDFGSKKEALTQLQLFCKTNKLPKPYLVDSGRGIHAYWPLAKAVGKQDWERVAKRLKAKCAELNFKADPSVTADIARILRLPGSYNYKNGDPIPCKLVAYAADAQKLTIEEFSEKLGVEFVFDPVLIPHAGTTNENLLSGAGNFIASFKTIVKKTAAGKGCAQLGAAIKNRAVLDEPTWRGALSIAVRCIDSDKGIEVVSKDHPDYSFERAKAKAEQTKGPYTCDYFSELNPDLCKECPNKNKIKSPIVLGGEIAEAEPNEDGDIVIPAKKESPSMIDRGVVIPKLPRTYFVGKEGGIYRKDFDSDGNPDHKLITRHILYAVDRTYDEKENEECMIMRLHMKMDGIRTFVLPNSTVVSAEKLRDTLARYGVLVENNSEVRRYVVAWSDYFQDTAEAKRPIRQYGWLDGNCTEFVLGENVYTKDGAQLALPSRRTAPYNSYFDPKGSLEAWRNAVSIWEDPKFVQQQYAMGVSFGSVLMQMDNTHASILHLHSKESGVGKTALLTAICSVWGRPESLIMKREDTTASKMNRCEIMHNLPIAMDEITNMNAAEASDLIYQLTGGQQRSRMSNSANEERVRGDVWSLMAVTTGNMSLIDMVCGYGGKASPQAEAQRVLELYVDRKFNTYEDKKLADGFLTALAKNYGHAGPVFVQYVMNNPIVVDRVITSVREAVDTKANLTSENRFWSAQVTYVVAGLILAKRAGLINYDAKNVLKWAVTELLVTNKQAVHEQNNSPVEYVSEYLAANLGNILQVNSTGDEVGDNNQILAQPEEKARIRLIGRFEPDTRKLYLLPGPFREWCIQRQIPYKRIISELKNTNNAQGNVSKKLGTGTKLKLPNKKVIAMDWDTEMFDAHTHNDNQ